MVQPITLSLALLACTCSLQVAEATASNGATIEGDGAVRLGGKTITHLTKKQLRLWRRNGAPNKPASVRSLAVAGHEVAHIQVGSQTTATGLNAGRTIEIVYAIDQQRILFQGITGLQGVDGEWSKHLTLSAEALETYETRAGFRQCDQANDTAIFRARYDWKTRSFRSTPPSMTSVEKLSRSIPSLVANPLRPAQSFSTAYNLFRVEGASTRSGDKGSASGLQTPIEIQDGDIKTAWVAGDPGMSRGHFITFRRSDSPYALRAIDIVPGHGGSSLAFRRFNRLKTIQLRFADEQQTYRVTFPLALKRAKDRSLTPHRVTFPRPIVTSCVSLVIEDLFPGKVHRSGTPPTTRNQRGCLSHRGRPRWRNHSARRRSNPPQQPAP